jgi:hypothetical protein
VVFDSFFRNKFYSLKSKTVISNNVSKRINYISELCIGLQFLKLSDYNSEVISHQINESAVLLLNSQFNISQFASKDNIEASYINPIISLREYCFEDNGSSYTNINLSLWNSIQYIAVNAIKVITGLNAKESTFTLETILFNSANTILQAMIESIDYLEVHS